ILHVPGNVPDGRTENALHALHAQQVALDHAQEGRGGKLIVVLTVAVQRDPLDEADGSQDAHVGADAGAADLQLLPQLGQSACADRPICSMKRVTPSGSPEVRSCDCGSGSSWTPITY